MWSLILSGLIPIAQAGLLAGSRAKQQKEQREAAEAEHQKALEENKKARRNAIREQEEQTLLGRQRIESERLAGIREKDVIEDQQKKAIQQRRASTLSGMQPNPSRTAQDLTGKSLRRL